MSALCPVCGFETPSRHDHQTDNSGLDDGPPMWKPRKAAAPKPDKKAATASVLRPLYKKPAPKSVQEMAEIRARAWATRRAKYGAHGHG